jgi:hypothetical protein
VLHQMRKNQKTELSFLKPKGLNYFLQERLIPYNLTLMFMDYIQDVIKKELILDYRSRLRKVMNELSYDDINSYWLKFVGRLKDDILTQEGKNKEE